MVVVMNVFIAIIEEAYITIKMKNKNHWIYMYLKLDNEYVELKEDKRRKKTINNDERSDMERKESVMDVSLRGVDRKESFGNGNEKIENTVKGLDYFYSKMEDELVQIKKIMDDMNKIEDKDVANEVKRYNALKISDLEKKLSSLKEEKNK
jgi:hypothetical protein